MGRFCTDAGAVLMERIKRGAKAPLNTHGKLRWCRGGRVIHKFGAKVSPLAVHEFGTGEATAALSLACWLVRRSETMPRLKAQPLLAAICSEL